MTERADCTERAQSEGGVVEWVPPRAANSRVRTAGLALSAPARAATPFQPAPLRRMVSAESAAAVQAAAVARLLPFCTRLPKCELHAHLNGCIRDETLW